MVMLLSSHDSYREMVYANMVTTSALHVRGLPCQQQHLQLVVFPHEHEAEWLPGEEGRWGEEEGEGEGEAGQGVEQGEVVPRPLAPA